MRALSIVLALVLVLARGGELVSREVKQFRNLNGTLIEKTAATVRVSGSGGAAEDSVEFSVQHTDGSVHAVRVRGEAPRIVYHPALKGFIPEQTQALIGRVCLQHKALVNLDAPLTEGASGGGGTRRLLGGARAPAHVHALTRAQHDQGFIFGAVAGAAAGAWAASRICDNLAKQVDARFRDVRGELANHTARLNKWVGTTKALINKNAALDAEVVKNLAETHKLDRQQALLIMDNTNNIDRNSNNIDAIYGQMRLAQLAAADAQSEDADARAALAFKLTARATASAAAQARTDAAVSAQFAAHGVDSAALWTASALTRTLVAANAEGVVAANRRIDETQAAVTNMAQDTLASFGAVESRVSADVARMRDAVAGVVSSTASALSDLDADTDLRLGALSAEVDTQLGALAATTQAAVAASASAAGDALDALAVDTWGAFDAQEAQLLAFQAAARRNFAHGINYTDARIVDLYAALDELHAISSSHTLTGLANVTTWARGELESLHTITRVNFERGMSASDDLAAEVEMLRALNSDDARYIQTELRRLTVDVRDSMGLLLDVYNSREMARAASRKFHAIVAEQDPALWRLFLKDAGVAPTADYRSTENPVRVDTLAFLATTAPRAALGGAGAAGLGPADGREALSLRLSLECDVDWIVDEARAFYTWVDIVEFVGPPGCVMGGTYVYTSSAGDACAAVRGTACSPGDACACTKLDAPEASGFESCRCRIALEGESCPSARWLNATSVDAPGVEPALPEPAGGVRDNLMVTWLAPYTEAGSTAVAGYSATPDTLTLTEPRFCNFSAAMAALSDAQVDAMLAGVGFTRAYAPFSDAYACARTGACSVPSANCSCILTPPALSADALADAEEAWLRAAGLAPVCEVARDPLRICASAPAALGGAWGARHITDLTDLSTLLGGLCGGGALPSSDGVARDALPGTSWFSRSALRFRETPGLWSWTPFVAPGATCATSLLALMRRAEDVTLPLALYTGWAAAFSGFWNKVWELEQLKYGRLGEPTWSESVPYSCVDGDCAMRCDYVGLLAQKAHAEPLFHATPVGVQKALHVRLDADADEVTTSASSMEMDLSFALPETLRFAGHPRCAVGAHDGCAPPPVYAAMHPEFTGDRVRYVYDAPDFTLQTPLHAVTRMGRATYILDTSPAVAAGAGNADARFPAAPLAGPLDFRAPAMTYARWEEAYAERFAVDEAAESLVAYFRAVDAEGRCVGAASVNQELCGLMEHYRMELCGAYAASCSAQWTAWMFEPAPYAAWTDAACANAALRASTGEVAWALLCSPAGALRSPAGAGVCVEAAAAQVAAGGARSNSTLCAWVDAAHMAPLWGGVVRADAAAWDAACAADALSAWSLCLRPREWAYEQQVLVAAGDVPLYTSLTHGCPSWRAAPAGAGVVQVTISNPFDAQLSTRIVVESPGHAECDDARTVQLNAAGEFTFTLPGCAARALVEIWGRAAGDATGVWSLACPAAAGVGVDGGVDLAVRTPASVVQDAQLVSEATTVLMDRTAGAVADMGAALSSRLVELGAHTAAVAAVDFVERRDGTRRAARAEAEATELYAAVRELQLSQGATARYLRAQNVSAPVAEPDAIVPASRESFVAAAALRAWGYNISAPTLNTTLLGAAGAGDAAAALHALSAELGVEADAYRNESATRAARSEGVGEETLRVLRDTFNASAPDEATWAAFETRVRVLDAIFDSAANASAMSTGLAEVSAAQAAAATEAAAFTRTLADALNVTTAVAPLVEDLSARLAAAVNASGATLARVPAMMTQLDVVNASVASVQARYAEASAALTEWNTVTDDFRVEMNATVARLREYKPLTVLNLTDMLPEALKALGSILVDIIPGIAGFLGDIFGSGFANLIQTVLIVAACGALAMCCFKYQTTKRVMQVGGGATGGVLGGMGAAWNTFGGGTPWAQQHQQPKKHKKKRFDAPSKV